MTLFDKFKNTIPTNDLLIKRVLDRVLYGKPPKDIKIQFSDLLIRIHDDIYKEYLYEQENSGQKVINDEIKKKGTISFNDLDSFLLSISQSRKSRAGKAFELIIENLLTKLGYPYSKQVVIEGAKPDYVLPSEEYFLKQPLDSILLTAKRTLRERWRQVVTEANKGYGYFLATIDDGISKNQIELASKNKIFIVVPRALKQSVPHYKESYSVITFEEFFENYLDPAMRRWGMKVSEPTPPEYKSSQKPLF